MKTLVRTSLVLTVLGGLFGALGAIVFLPAYAADAGTAALVIGALAVYALGAMAMVEYNRSRALTLLRNRRRTIPGHAAVLRLPADRRDVKKLAA